MLRYKLQSNLNFFPVTGVSCPLWFGRSSRELGFYMEIAMSETESKEFADAFFSAGTYHSVDCTCGRTYFCTSEYGVWNETEEDEDLLENLKGLSESEPKKFIECDYTIRWGVIDNKNVVEGCECGTLRKYEDWIWGHRYLILEYLKNRQNAHKAENDMLTTSINSAEEDKANGK